MVLCALLVLNTEWGRILTGRWSFTKSVETDRGRFFRLVLAFDYRGTPQHFDVVYGCDVRITRYKDGGSSYEPGLTPVLYGRRMDDGQIVAVRSVLACEGETTANGRVPEAILPLMLVYPVAEDPSFAVAYFTSDAYASPHAELTRPKARVETASYQDFLASRARADNALARPAPGAASIADKALTLQEAELTLGFKVATYCAAFLRVRLPEELREEVRASWPADRPRFWAGPYRLNERGAETQTPNQEISWRLHSSSPRPLVRSDGPDDPLVAYDRLTRSGQPNQGMPNRENARIQRGPYYLLGAAYPSGINVVLTDPARVGRHVVPWPAGDGRFDSLDLRDLSMRGFAYCHYRDPPSKGRGVDGVRTSGNSDSNSFFERDEYFYQLNQILTQTRGGM